VGPNGQVDRPADGPYPPLVIALLLISLAFLLSGCAESYKHEREFPIPLSDQHERIIGGRLATRFETGARAATDPVVNDYVSQLGQKIARLSDRPEIPIAFRIIDDPNPRAVAFPGGHIYISVGLLRQIDTECQLAGVLAHEIAHVAGHDPSKALERDLSDLEMAAIAGGERTATRSVDSSAAGAKALAILGIGYGAETERQADQTALLYTSRVGLNPEGLIEVIEHLNPTNAKKYTFWEPLAGGHPWPAQRAVLLEAELKSLGLDAGLPRDLHPYAPIKNRLK
jgi:beta-barrel assembly-enhancing protease